MPAGPDWTQAGLQAGRLTFLKRLVYSALVLCGVVAVALFLPIHRGFRAATPPPPWEVAVARGLRNFAIPSSERNEKDPVPASSESLRRARDLFLSRCAGCHGPDGSGRTPIGSNVYPRVPDLRSTPTQNLTDGELHYIIANGVQLTGMPALSGTGSSVEAWELVRFVRSLRVLDQKQQVQDVTNLTSAHYTGSQSCEKCHQEIYARWKKTPMANVVRDPRDHPDAIIPNLATNAVAKFTKEQMAFVYGSIWKQRYFTKVGEDYFPISAQWDVANHSWRPYKVPNNADWWTAFYPDDNMQRPTGPTCDGCHSVGYDIHTKQPAEWNVGCERCHGPGSEHVAHPGPHNILNPGYMDSVAATDTCIQCHSQGQPLTKPIEGKYYDWPVGYNVGLKLADYWKLEDCTLGQTTFYYFPDCNAHKNRMQGNDFAQSVMYRRGITCSNCHDVHGTPNYAQLRKPANQICLDCHAPSSSNGPRTASIEEHTHHKHDSAGNQCIACHMPAIETEGVPGTFVHAHTFRFISPEMTDKYAIPDPCTSCHKDKTTAWATDQMKKWPSYSPWQPAP
jgi:predicted CXXCH cytochrome family protein